jgi:hypothetical protein
LEAIGEGKDGKKLGKDGEEDNDDEEHSTLCRGEGLILIKKLPYK